MKITDIRTIRAGKYLFIVTETDAGITGIGESGAWSFPDAVIGAIQRFRAGLLGQDPFQIEHHWQAMYRSSYFRGSIVMSAIAGIDISLWDIKGKALGVPVYELLGGKCREMVRAYAPVFAFSPQEMAEGCKRVQSAGFTAARLMLTDAISKDRHDISGSIHACRVAEAIEKVRCCREAVGERFDLCIEVHRSMQPSEAIAFAKGVEAYHPMFIEDPIPPDNCEVMADVAHSVVVPIATGERFIDIQEFELLLAKRGARYVRPDVCAVGGLTPAKKIASIAEAHYVGIVPHNPLGPVSTAACLQLDACIPNFAIQEFPSFYEAGGESGMMQAPFVVKDGCIMIPDAPGIGIELIPNIEAVYPPQGDRQTFHVQTSFDGSVRDY